jgi:ribosomal protein S18 acetylase RimI-like enzyme
VPSISRRWAPTDIPDVQHIAWTTWLATYGGFIPEADIRSHFDEYYATDVLERICTDDRARGYLAEWDERPVGFARAAFDPEEGRCYLASLYVLPDFQGRGLGSQLLRACERFALDQGAAEIWLGVMRQNVTALAWYRRIGFRFVREEPFTMGRTTVQHLLGHRALRLPHPES